MRALSLLSPWWGHDPKVSWAKDHLLSQCLLWDDASDRRNRRQKSSMLCMSIVQTKVVISVGLPVNGHVPAGPCKSWWMGRLMWHGKRQQPAS